MGSLVRDCVRGVVRDCVRTAEEGFGGGGIPTYNPAFWLNNLGLSNQTVTNVRTSTATAWDHEGVLVTGEAGEIMLDGGRRVKNKVTSVAAPISSPDDMTLAHTQSVSITYAGGESTLEVTATGESYARPQQNFTDSYYTKGHEYIFSVKVKGVGTSIGRKIFLVSEATGDTHSPAVTTLTGEYLTLQFARPVKLGAPGEKPKLRLGGHVDANMLVGEQVLVKNWLIEDTTGSTIQIASEYIDSGIDHGYGVNGVKWYSTTNGNTESGGVVTSAPGVAIDPVPQVLMQPQRTNAVVNNCFSELGTGGADVFAGWSETVAGTSAITQETADLPPGFTTVCRFDVDSSGSLTRIADVSRLVVGIGGVATISAQIKAANASGLKFRLFADDGAWGSPGYLSADGLSWSATPTIFTPDNLPTSWGHWEYTLPALTGLRTAVAFEQIMNNVGVSVSHLFTALQLEEGLVATTPIQTTTAPVTRDNDYIEVDGYDSFIDTTEGVLLMAFTHDSDILDTGKQNYLRGGAGSNRFIKHETNQNGIWSTSQTASAKDLSGGIAGSEFIVGVGYSAELNGHFIGYKQESTGTWTWGATEVFTSWVANAEAGDLLGILHNIADTTRVRHAANYKGLPPGTTTITEVQDWLEAEAANEILKYEG